MFCVRRAGACSRRKKAPSDEEASPKVAGEEKKC